MVYLTALTNPDGEKQMHPKKPAEGHGYSCKTLLIMVTLPGYFLDAEMGLCSFL